MKLRMKPILVTALIAVIISSCGESTEIEKVNTSDEYLDLVGTVEYRKASATELKNLVRSTNKANCTLDGDADCTDNPQASFEGYVKDCTTYSRTWPPTGSVSVVYKSLIYYVDGDGDINLDHYQDDLQAHVDQIVSSNGGSAAFISADIIYWECNGRENNSCVIKYSLYK